MDLRSRIVFVIGVGICATWPLLGGVPVWAADLTVEEQARYADLEARPLHGFTNVDLAESDCAAFVE